MIRQTMIVIFVLIFLILGAMFAFNVFESKSEAEKPAEQTEAAPPAPDASTDAPTDATAEPAEKSEESDNFDPFAETPKAEENPAPAPESQVPATDGDAAAAPTEETAPATESETPVAEGATPPAAETPPPAEEATETIPPTEEQPAAETAAVPAAETAPAPAPLPEAVEGKPASIPAPAVKEEPAPQATVSSAATKEERVAERVLGKDNAPVTVVEYASLTCPHCAAFNKDVLPQIVKEYVDTGKVKLIMRDLPTSAISTSAARLTRCVKPDLYKSYVDGLFNSQGDWLTASDPIKPIKQLGVQLGLTDKEMDACLNDDALLAKIAERAKEAADVHKINATPSFVIFDKANNKGEVISGKQDFAKFKQVFDKLLAQ